MLPRPNSNKKYVPLAKQLHPKTLLLQSKQPSSIVVAGSNDTTAAKAQLLPLPFDFNVISPMLAE